MGPAADTGSCSTALGRFAGPAGDEIAILCLPESRSPDPAHQAAAAYRALAAQLAAHQASVRDLTAETLFLRDVRRELPMVLDVRTQVLADLGTSPGAPAPAFIQQAPIGEGARVAVLASALVPRRRDAWSVRDFRVPSTCSCEGCARSGARFVCLGDQKSLYTANVYGSGSDAFEQAWEMFCGAERLLDQCGMGFRDVVRTWVHLRDIDRDYDALNLARRQFFRQRGIEPRPASTGVQGIPFPDAHDFSMSLHAVQSQRPLDVEPMSTPLLNEAWSYGVDFSRGLRIVDANAVRLYVSGTASIDAAGQTVHVGSFAAQVDRMLDNVASLLAEQGASFANLVSGVAYIRNPSDAPLLHSICQKRGFDGFPCALVQTSLCRPELLCEAEAVALLPLPAAAA